MDPVYALILLAGFGSKGVALNIDAGEILPSKHNCEVELARRLKNAPVPRGAARIGGACIVMEGAK
jgi:hypothetical protein